MKWGVFLCNFRHVDIKNPFLLLISNGDGANMTIMLQRLRHRRNKSLPTVTKLTSSLIAVYGKLLFDHFFHLIKKVVQ